MSAARWWRRWWGRRPAAGPGGGQAPASGDGHDQVPLLALQDGGWFRHGTGELVPGFRITPDDVVVDVGCGRGRAILFAAAHGAEVIGVDVNERLFGPLGAALERSCARSHRLLRGEPDRVPLPDAIATKVICMEVLEHVADPTTIMAEVARITRPGGSILLSVPDPLAESLQKQVAPDVYWQPPNHVRVFEREAFETLATAAGLTVETRPVGSFFHALFWILFWADQPGSSRPAARHWMATWQALLDAPNGAAVRRALDAFMPKSQAIVARKAA